MRSFRKKLLTTTVIVTAVGVGAAGGVYAGVQTGVIPLSALPAWVVSACFACNPCNPCNPCAAKNPCNPCAAKNPCNPCAVKNPCNPCGAQNQ